MSVMVSLLLPAVQAVRERVRNLTCQNQLRQIGIAITNHESSFKHLPAGGWGYRWVGDANQGFGLEQPGGWIFNTLPFLELGAVREQAVSNSVQHVATSLSQPLPTFACPSRSAATPTPYLGITALHNADRPQLSFKSDYAGNGGDQQLPNGPGPDGAQTSDLKRYDCSTHPRWDNNYDAADSFGSRHPYGWNAVLGDGSIHQISFYIELSTHQRRCRQDQMSKRVFSTLANTVRCWVTSSTVTDSGCSMRAFRKDDSKICRLDFQGWHRFLVTLVELNRGKVSVVPVTHRPRRAGNSKYGVFRRGLICMLDGLAVSWLHSRRLAVADSQVSVVRRVVASSDFGNVENSVDEISVDTTTTAYKVDHCDGR